MPMGGYILDTGNEKAASEKARMPVSEQRLTASRRLVMRQQMVSANAWDAKTRSTIAHTMWLGGQFMGK